MENLPANLHQFLHQVWRLIIDIYHTNQKMVVALAAENLFEMVVDHKTKSQIILKGKQESFEASKRLPSAERGAIRSIYYHGSTTNTVFIAITIAPTHGCTHAIYNACTSQ